MHVGFRRKYNNLDKMFPSGKISLGLGAMGGNNFPMSSILRSFLRWGSPSNHLILCRPLLLLPSIFPRIRVFSNDSVLCIRWPKFWSFTFSISPFNEYSELISFKNDWFDILAVQWILKSLLQCHSSKASILQHSAFFIVQVSHLCMTTGKTIALTMGPP